MINKVLLMLVLVFGQMALAQTRNRMEELFLWKVSEDLKLSVSEEKALSDYVKSFNARRNQINEDIQNSLKKISETQEEKSYEKTFSEYKALIKKYNALTVEETEKTQKILGTARAAKYFVIKNDLANRVKTLLAVPDKPETKDKALGAPKVIVE